MTRVGLLISVIAAGSLGSSRASEPELMLTLSEGLSWKTIFDAGFRPEYDGFGTFKCRQRDLLLGVRLREDGPTMHLGKGDIDFTLFENNLLILIMFYGRENRTLEEARSNAATFSEIFGESVTRQNDVRVYTNGNVDIRDAGLSARMGDWSINYDYSRTYEVGKPLVERISMALKTDQARRARPMMEKITPPSGYEHVSLEPTLPVSSGANQRAPVGGAFPSRVDSSSGSDQVRDGNGWDKWMCLLLGLVLILLCIGCLWAYRRRRCGIGNGSRLAGVGSEKDDLID